MKTTLIQKALFLTIFVGQTNKIITNFSKHFCKYNYPYQKKKCLLTKPKHK